MSSSRKLPVLNILLILLACAAVGIGIEKSRSKKPMRLLPYIGERTVNANHDTDFHRVLPFKLTDQLGETVTLDTFKNKVFVANFFFATCLGICKKMNNELERATKSFRGNSKVCFVSYTVDPIRDSVPVLLEYAKLHDAVPHQWYFLTGDKKEIYMLARKSYYAAVDDSAGMNLVHTQNMALVDKKGHIRGIYSGTDSVEVNKLIVDINLLLQEEQ